MRIKNKILFITITLILVSLACSLSERSAPPMIAEDITNDPSMLNTIPVPTIVPTESPETQPTIIEPTATRTIQNDILDPIATPKTQTTHFETVELGGIYTYFWVVYDPNFWQIGENEFGQILINNQDPTCILRENIGMGIDFSDVTIQNDHERIANYEVVITQYIGSTGATFLEIFNFNSETIFIAIDTGYDPGYCRDAARYVVELSAENRFEPIQ